MTQAIISLFAGQAPICLPINESNNTAQLLKQQIRSVTSIPVLDQVLSTLGGRTVSDTQVFDLQQGLYEFNLSGRLLGGKGGFGSMLRAQGGRMNAQKTTNFEACRDLQGRRIKTVNDAKKLQEELDALPEREAEKREKLKRKIDDALKEREPKKHLFDDNQYLKDSEEMVENVKSVVGQALKRQKTNPKPVATSSVSAFDDDLSSDDSEEEEKDQVEISQKEIKLKVLEEVKGEVVEETTEKATSVKKVLKGKGKAKAT